MFQQRDLLIAAVTGVFVARCSASDGTPTRFAAEFHSHVVTVDYADH